MAKSPEIKVQLANNWFTGGRLLRKEDNPHTLPEQVLEALPPSAKVQKDEDFIPVADYRGGDEESADKDAAAKKTTLKL